MAATAPDDTAQSRSAADESIRKRLTLPRIAMLAVGPLAAGFAAWAEQNPVLALPILFAWAVLWLLGEIAADFIGRVWEKIRDRLVDRTADRLDLWIGNLLSRHRRRYLRDVIYQHRNVDLTGLTRGAHVPGLEDVFVDVSVAPISPSAASADMIRKLAPELREGRHRLWDFLQAGGDSAKLAILGAPGSGKTTLLRHVALAMAGGRSRTRRLRARRNLPILLFLREHDETIAEQPEIGLAELLAAYLKAKRKLDIPVAWFLSQLQGNRCLVMLDGLDEVPDPEVRKKVIAWAEQQMSIHGDNRFIITSRRHGYPESGMGEVTVLDIRPFTGEQVRSFVHKWYLADQIKSQGRDDPGVRRDAEDGADHLLQRLFANPALSDLAVNPLLLTMIAMVHRSGRALPGSRAELYAEICEVALGKRQQAKGIELDLTPIQKQAVLEPLAWHMMAAEKRELPAGEAARAIAKPLKKVDPKMTPRDFLISIEQSSGLLLEREGGIYSFAHLTFQEFLAACHAHQAGLVDRLTACVRDPWWRETLRLYAARSDATPILRACMAGDPPDPAALALALECREEAKEIAPKVRAGLDRFVEAGLDEMDPERRRPIAEALLKVRLARLRRLDEKRYIDPELITHAEYQLFLDDLRARGEHRQPDHWRGLHFAPGEARKPVVGLRFSDALTLCDWLTEREGGGWRFRPPTAEEEAEIGAATGASGIIPWRLIAPDIEVPATWSVPLSADGGASREQMVPNLLHDLVCDLDRDRALARELADAGAFAGARVLDRDCARALDSALDNALAGAPDLAREFARALNRALNHALDTGLARAFARACVLDRDRAHVPAGAFDRDHARELVHARALDSARELAHALNRAHGAGLARAWVRAGDRSRDLYHDLALARALAHDRPLARDRPLAGALDRARPLAGALDRDLTLDRAHDLERVRDLAHDLALALAFDRAHAPAEAFDRDHAHALDRALGYALALTLLFDLFAMANIVRYRSDEVTMQIDVIEAFYGRISAFNIWLLDTAVAEALATDRATFMADTRTRRLRPLQRFAARLFIPFGASVRQMNGSGCNPADHLTSVSATVYSALAFKRARLKGDDPPFEALRIVRERMEPSSGGP